MVRRLIAAAMLAPIPAQAMDIFPIFIPEKDKTPCECECVPPPPVYPDDCDPGKAISISLTVENPAELRFIAQPYDYTGENRHIQTFATNTCKWLDKDKYRCSSIWPIPRDNQAWEEWTEYAGIKITVPRCVYYQ